MQKCGQKVVRASASQAIEVGINPFETFMAKGDKCSYMIQVDDYQDGDMIELSQIDSVKMNLVLFSGGYSLTTSTNRLELVSGTKYMLDGTQKLFLVADTLEEDQLAAFSKPYFTLQTKKVPDAAAATGPSPASAHLEDTSILANTITVAPLTETLETVHETVTTVEIYASILEEREVQAENMEKVDVALLTIMWVCLSIALALSLSICAVITCRRKIVTSLKV